MQNTAIYIPNLNMANIALALKAEISRVARKEVRAQTGQMKSASSSYRHQIARMRKRIEDLEKQLRRLGRAAPAGQKSAEVDESERQLRFSAARFANHRRRLGLSAREMGALIGVSALSVYKWEKGESRPRQRQLEAISAVRRLGKREAVKRLESLS